MFKKIIIPSIVVVLTIAVGGGVWYFATHQPQKSVAKDTTSQKLDISKIPEPKLVAEYKFDSPISDAVFYDNGKPKVVATEAYIRFYNPDGTIRKEIKTKDIKHKENGRIVDSRETAQISKNGEYVAVIHNVKMGIGWVKYLDRNGKILFEKEFGIGDFWVAPNGDYLVFSEPYETNFIDAKGKIIASYKKTSIEDVVFSKDGDKCLLTGRSRFSNKQVLLLFIDMGRKQIFKYEMPARIGSVAISDNGEYFAVDSGDGHGGGVLCLYSLNGLVWKKTNNDSQPIFLGNRMIITTSRSRDTNKKIFVLYSINGEKVKEFDPEPFGKEISSVGGPIRAAISNNRKIIIYLMYSGNEYVPESICNYIIIRNIDTGRFTFKKFHGLGGADDPNFIASETGISLTGNYLIIRGKEIIRVFKDFIK